MKQQHCTVDPRAVEDGKTSETKTNHKAAMFEATTHSLTGNLVATGGMKIVQGVISLLNTHKCFPYENFLDSVI